MCVTLTVLQGDRATHAADLSQNHHYQVPTTDWMRALRRWWVNVKKEPTDRCTDVPTSTIVPSYHRTIHSSMHVVCMTERTLQSIDIRT